MPLKQLPSLLGPLLILAGLAASAGAHADALSELRTRLGAMNGNEPLKATVQFENWSRSGDYSKPHVIEGRISASVTQTATGLQVLWDRELLQQATLEARRHNVDPEQDTPTRDALKALSAYDLQHYFNGADRLLNLLEDATLAGEQTDMLDGKPARVLLLSSKPPLSEHDRKYVKDIEAGGKLWLDADGYPLALEDHYTVQGSIMMVIRFTGSQRDEYRYARIGNHLVTTRHVSEDTHTGGGEDGQSRQTTTLQFALPDVVARTP